MIYFPLSKFVDSAETVVAPGAVITAEGQALVRAPGAPATGVTVSMADDDTEIFAGFSIAGVSAAPMPVYYASKVEEFIVPASGVVSLAFTPVPGELFAYNLTTSTAVAEPEVTENTVIGLTAGNTLRITYKYALSAVQARALQGDVQPGGYAGEYVGQIGLIKRGLIFTDQFDSSVDWSAATGIRLAPNGMVTNQDGEGAEIKGYVVSVPNVETPFLGIEFSAA
jgi:hypothetical protein